MVCQLDLDTRVKPFLGVGLGGETMDYDIKGTETHGDFMLVGHAGLNIPLTDLWGLKLEARDCITWFDSNIEDEDTSEAQNELMLLTGLSIRFPFGRK